MEELRYPIGEFNRRDSLDEVTRLVPSVLREVVWNPVWELVD